MGMFKEYLTMAAKGMNNIPNVLQGNFNRIKDALGMLPPDQQIEAERRYQICKGCPFHSHNAINANFYESSRLEEHCSVCKCPIESKVMAFGDACGLTLLEVQYDSNMNRIGGIDGYKRLWDVYKNEE